MAATLRSYALRGFLVPDPRATFGSISAVDSSYSQSGPRVGTDVAADPRSRAVVVLSGEQSSSLTVTAEAAGMPSLSGGRWRYRLTSDASTADRGWNPPMVMSDWTAIEMSNATTYSPLSACVIPSTQKVVHIYTNATGVFSRTWTAGTWVWGSRITISASTYNVGAVWCGANERVFAALWSSSTASQALYYSDDAGATWSLGATGIFITQPLLAQVRSRAFIAGDDVFLMCSSGTNIDQYASSSLGTSFTRIVLSAGTYDNADACVTASGKVVVVARNNATSKPVAFVVGSAWQSFASASVITVDPSQTLTGDMTCWSTRTGEIYASGRSTSSVYLWRSVDDGATWTLCDFGVWASGDASTYPTNPIGVEANGQSLYISGWASATGGGYDTKSIGAAILGGWSQLTTGDNGAYGVTKRIGFGVHATQTTHTWWPIIAPSGLAFWTASGAGTDVLGSGIVTFTTAANQRKMLRGIGTDNYAEALYEIQITSGSLHGSDIGISNGATCYETFVRFTTTTIVFVDVDGATIATVTPSVAPTAQIYEIAHLAIGGRHEAYYRSKGSTTWLLIGASGAITGHAAATGFVSWGAPPASSTGVSVWTFCAMCSGSSPASAGPWAETLGFYSTSTIGRALTAFACPLGDQATAGATSLSILDGPAVIAESHVIAASADYPVSNLFYQVAPSPRAAWRSTDTTQQVIVVALDGTNRTSMGSSTLAFAVLNSNIPALLVEGNVGGVWYTLGNFSAKVWSGLKYVITGDTVRVNAAGSTTWRAIRRGELVGCDFLCDNGTVHSITRHQEGLWSASGGLSGKQAELIINAGSGAADASGTAGAIVARNWVGVAHNWNSATGLGLYKQFRFTIATATTSAGYFQIGTLLPGTFQPLGHQPAWGNIYGFKRSQETVTTRDGVDRTRKLGPAIRSLTMSIDNVDQTALNGSQPSPDYLAAKAGYPGLANYDDAPWLLAGLLDELDSGAVPVVALLSVPDASSSDTSVISDPELFLYGRIGDVSLEVIQGDEGSSTAGEVLRVQQLQVRGIP